MIQFFIRHKKVRGVITVFLTLIYLSVYLLIGIFVDGGRVRMAGVVVEDIQQIATENVMSQYNRGLYEYYGLFGVSNYEVDQIAKDVKSQIEESVGLKVSEDSIKELMFDTINGVNAAIENSNILDSDGNVIKNVEDYARKIQNEISDSKKRFNPYGIEIKNVTAKYIDLSNQDALRAQIRDDMRYEAIMIPTMGFFDSVNKLMEIAGGVDSMVKITSKMGSSSDVSSKYKEFKNKLKEFSISLKSLIEETYEVEWKTVDSLKYKAENKPVRKSTGFFDWLFGNKNSTDDTIVDNDSNHYSDINDSFRVGDGVGSSKTGLSDYLDEVKLYKYYEDFDNENGWPEPVYKTVGSGENAHEVYDRSGHQQAIRAEAESRASEYRNETFGSISSGTVGKLIYLITESQAKVEETVSSMNRYLDAVSDLIAEYDGECVKAKDDVSKKLFASQIETNLKVWNDGAERRKVLNEINKKLSNLMSDSFLSKFESAISTTISAVVHEANENSNWHPTTKLLTKSENVISEFHSNMVELVDWIDKYQELADGGVQSKHLFQLLEAVSTTISGKKGQDKNLFEVLDSFGNIEKHYAKSDYSNSNEIFDYAEYLKSSKVENDNSETFSFGDDDSEVFSKEEEKMVDKVNGLFSKVGDLVSKLTTALFENVYDETYILTHCRDFVHTYRYDEELDVNDKKDTDLDFIFNRKFIEDQSDTKYLSNIQFKNIQVTPAEIEHIIFNLEKSKDEVILMYTSIFAIRLVLNLIAVYTGPAAKEAKALALIPGVGTVASFAAPLACALSQSWLEMGGIMGCKQENLYNRDINLWDPILKIADDKIDDLKDTLIDESNKLIQVGTKDLLNQVKANNRLPEDSKISNAVRTIEQLISDGTYEEFIPSNVDETISSNVGSVENVSGPKAGYTTYLLIFLLVNSFNKKGQISNLQDVIETNMKKAQADFSLDKTYSQVSVETESTIKYIFMTQSFMKRTFSSTGDESYNSYPLKIKTAFAY